MFANLMGHLPMLLCVLLGAGLMIVEVFLPGFGLPGISGIVLIGAGVVMAWMEAGALVAIAILLVIIAVLAVFISWVLRTASSGRSSHAEIFLREKEELSTREDMQVLVGRRGRTTSVLRPAGIGDFDGVRLNVVTEGEFIERNTPIEIVSANGTRIVVRSMQEEEACGG